MKNFSNELFENYDLFKEHAITKRRFSFKEYSDTIQKHFKSTVLKSYKTGKSIENRPIYSFVTGSGKIPVMLWSQMHGNEPTATLALLDIFNFLTQNEHFQEEIKRILAKLEILFVPLVNPDGAQQFKRRNAVNIDLNRDAESLTAPESRFLMGLRDSFEPDFGFNLHDQDSHFSAGVTDKPAAMAFLAPAFDEERSVSNSRKKAMQLIAGMHEELQEFIPKQTAKYSDAFNPKCFGDAVQKKGTSTILIESGWTHNDPEKQFIRKLNFVIILNSLLSIATNEYKRFEIQEYKAIPDNHFNLFDLIVRNVQIRNTGQSFTIDIGIKNTEKELSNLGDFITESSIDNLGDLSAMHSYKNVDAKGLVAVSGTIFTKEINSLEQLNELDIKTLHKDGFTTIKSKIPNELQKHSSDFYFVYDCIDFENRIDIKVPANFVLKENGIVKYLVVNGFLKEV